MSKVQHIRKFDGGRRTPQEYHAEFGFPPNAKCAACSAKPTVRAIVMMSLDDAEKRGLAPPGSSKMPMLFPALQPVLVQLREAGSPRWYVRVSLAYSCSRCRAGFERELAKAPSWAVVEINDGPDSKNRVSLGAG